MIELQPVWRFVRRWWWLMLLPAVVATVLTFVAALPAGLPAGGYSTQFTYTAAQRDSNLMPRDGDFQDVWLASEFTVNAFTEWVRSSSFREELQTLLPDVSLDSLGIASDNARSIGQVQMSHMNSEALGRIAAAAITVLQTRNHAYFPHLGSEPAAVTIINKPVVVATPPPLPNRFEPLIRGGLGLVAGIALALLADFLDRRVRETEDIEQQGVRLIGRIPR